MNGFFYITNNSISKNQIEFLIQSVSKLTNKRYSYFADSCFNTKLNLENVGNVIVQP